LQRRRFPEPIVVSFILVGLAGALGGGLTGLLFLPQGGNHPSLLFGERWTSVLLWAYSITAASIGIAAGVCTSLSRHFVVQIVLSPILGLVLTNLGVVVVVYLSLDMHSFEGVMSSLTPFYWSSILGIMGTPLLTLAHGVAFRRATILQSLQADSRPDQPDQETSID